MSDPTIPLLAAYTQALLYQKVPTDEQQLALLFAKEFLKQVAKEDGRLDFGELKSATLAKLDRQLSKYSEALMHILIDPERGFGTLNRDMRPVFLKNPS